MKSTKTWPRARERPDPQRRTTNPRPTTSTYYFRPLTSRHVEAEVRRMNSPAPANPDAPCNCDIGRAIDDLKAVYTQAFQDYQDLTETRKVYGKGTMMQSMKSGDMDLVNIMLTIHGYFDLTCGLLIEWIRGVLGDPRKLDLSDKEDLCKREERSQKNKELTVKIIEDLKKDKEKYGKVLGCGRS